MKKIALLFAVSVLLFSCKKKVEKHCWNCATTVTWDPVANTTTSNNVVCDKTESEIRDYEKAASTTSTTSSGGITLTGTAVTKCTQQ